MQRPYTILVVLVVSLLVVISTTEAQEERVQARNEHDQPLFDIVQKRDSAKAVKRVAGENPSANVNGRSVEGDQTLLLTAIMRGHNQAAKGLLDLGADANLGSGEEQWMPVDAAAGKGNAPMIQMLHDMGNVNVRKASGAADGLTPLQRACNGRYSFHAQTVAILLRIGVDDNDVKRCVAQNTKAAQYVRVYCEERGIDGCRPDPVDRDAERASIPVPEGYW